VKVATYVVFAECCWFATSAVFDVQYAIPEVLAVGAASLIPDADYPESWLGYRLGRVSKDLYRLFGHRSFLHSLLALGSRRYSSGLAYVVDCGQLGTRSGHLRRLW
jgi:inner membrane protein